MTDAESARPGRKVAVGDWATYGQYRGTVEEIFAVVVDGKTVPHATIRFRFDNSPNERLVSPPAHLVWPFEQGEL